MADTTATNGRRTTAPYRETRRSGTEAAQAKSCRGQRKGRPDDPVSLPCPEQDHQGHGSENQGEETPHENFTQPYEDPWNKDTGESLENQQTSYKNNSTDCQGHSYHSQAGSHSYKDQRNNDTLETFESQQTNNKNNPTDCQELSYHNQGDKARGHEQYLEGNEETTLLFFLFEHQPEDQAENNGIVLDNAEHTATQADGRRACDKRGNGTQRQTRHSTPFSTGNQHRHRHSDLWRGREHRRSDQGKERAPSEDETQFKQEPHEPRECSQRRRTPGRQCKHQCRGLQGWRSPADHLGNVTWRSRC